MIYAQFGVGYEVSAYRTAISVPDTLFNLMAAGALGSAFIPLFTRLRMDDRDEKAWELASGVFVMMGVGIAVLTAIAWIFAPLIIKHGLAAGAGPREQVLAIRLVRIILLQPFFLALATVATSILQSFDQFTLPAFSPALYNLCIILGALLPFVIPGIGIYGVAIGVVVGGAVFLGIQLPSAVRLGLRLPRSLPIKNPHVWEMLKLLAPRVVGQAAVQANLLVAIALGNTIGPGAVAALGAANVLFVLPVGLFGTSISTVAFPSLSREATEADRGRFLYLLRRALRAVLFFVLPAAVGLLLLRAPIVSLIYQHGAVKPDQVNLIAQPLLFFALAMPAFALSDLLPRAFYALHDTYTPVKIALISVALDIVLSLALVHRLQLQGLALAYALAVSVQTLLLLTMLSRKIGTVVDRSTATFLLKALLAVAVMAVFLLLAQPFLSGASEMHLTTRVLRVLVTVGVGAAVYLGLSVLLRQDEIRTILRAAR